MALSKAVERRVMWVLVALGIMLGGGGAALLLYVGGINARLVYLEMLMRSGYSDAKSDFERSWTRLCDETSFPKDHNRDFRRVFDEVMTGEISSDEGTLRIVMTARAINPHADTSVADTVNAVLKDGLKKHKVHLSEIAQLRHEFDKEAEVFPISLIAAYFGFPHIDHEAQAESLLETPEEDRRRSRSNPFKKRREP